MDEAGPLRLQRIPTSRMATMEGLQNAVAYLASETSEHATGSDILVYGGYCIW